MDTFNIYGEIKLGFNFDANLIKYIKTKLLKEKAVNENYQEEKYLVLEEIIDIIPNYETSELIISLIPNKDVTYLNNCIPNCSEALLLNSLHYVIEDIIKMITAENKEMEIKTSGKIEFHTDIDGNPQYKIYMKGDNKIIIARKKSIEDYKNVLIDIHENKNIDIINYINNDHININEYEIENLRDA